MTTQTMWNRPYILHAFGTTERTRGKGKRQRTETIGYGYLAWNPDHTVEPSRLAGSGSFCWPGLHAARAAALAELAKPEIHQVSLRTNQDREVMRYYRRPDGTVKGYLDVDTVATIRRRV